MNKKDDIKNLTVQKNALNETLQLLKFINIQEDRNLPDEFIKEGITEVTTEYDIVFDEGDVVEFKKTKTIKRSSKLNDKHLAFIFGVVFVFIMIILSFLSPNPTSFQYLVFRVVLSLSAAGIITLIPGFLNIKISTGLKAGGAIAAFVAVYFMNPASLPIITP